MKLIPLSQRSKIDAGKYFTKVDDVDYDFLMQWLWRKDFSGYASRNVYLGIKNGKQIQHGQRMHRLILGVTDPSIHVDHIDGDGLNNQRSNLRTCTNTENSRNSRKPKGNYSSVYKGVKVISIKSKRILKSGISKIYIITKIQAAIMVNRKVIYLGTFKTEEEAARAYDIAAKKYFGEFANLNFPE